MSIDPLRHRDNERGEGRRAYALTDPVELATLAGEIGNAKKGEPPVFVCEGDPASASEEAPVTLWVPKGLSEKRLVDALAKHRPAPHPLEALLARARSDDAFTPDELQAAVKALLLQRYGT